MARKFRKRKFFKKRKSFKKRRFLRKKSYRRKKFYKAVKKIIHSEAETKYVDVTLNSTAVGDGS